MKYWLMKSEPDVFSLEHLRRAGVAGWDGVRNYQARNFMREMKRGDLALFYHSSCEPSAIVGKMEIVREAYPDPTQFDPRGGHFDPASRKDAPRWLQVDVRFKAAFRRPMTLKDARAVPGLEGMVLLKRGRLSVQPVSREEWELILKSCE